MFPPSPALSAVDSLDGIDDLDAFLDAQGALSRFPTPPLGKTCADDGCNNDAVDSPSVLDDIYDGYGHNEATKLDCRSPSASHPQRLPSTMRQVVASKHGSTNIRLFFADQLAAAILAKQATSCAGAPLPELVDALRSLLVRAEFPREILAIALNILDAFRIATAKVAGGEERMPFLPATCDRFVVLVVAACDLAVSYTTDHPPRRAWWAQHICCDAWPSAVLDATARELLIALDWRLHELTAPARLEAAMRAFTPLPAAQLLALDAAALKQQQHLRLLIENSTTRWEHGQLTPEESCPLASFTAVPSLLCENATPISPSPTAMGPFLRLL